MCEPCRSCMPKLHVSSIVLSMIASLDVQKAVIGLPASYYLAPNFTLTSTWGSVSCGRKLSHGVIVELAVSSSPRALCRFAFTSIAFVGPGFDLRYLHENVRMDATAMATKTANTITSTPVSVWKIVFENFFQSIKLLFLLVHTTGTSSGNITSMSTLRPINLTLVFATSSRSSQRRLGIRR